MNRLLLPFTLLAAAVLAANGIAQVEADPNKDYQISPEAGEWLICATSYVGPQAAQLAHEMVLEIRSRFKMPAYVLNRGEEERRKQEAETASIKQQYEAANAMRRQNNEPEVPLPRRYAPRVQDQCAVLVGGYKDQDAAYHALKDFKKLPSPSSERLCPVILQVPVNGGENAPVNRAYANPFVQGFVVPNPTIAHARKGNEQEDPFLKKLNSSEKYSLLKCKKPYTLLVAAFQGLHTIQATSAGTANEGFIAKFFGNSSGEMLAASGQNAQNLADALRKLGFEAYVLHMREGSAVTIGGFDREDDPQIKRVEQLLATRIQYGQGVQLLPQALVMRVPHP
jgi:hypothetical protein